VIQVTRSKKVFKNLLSEIVPQIFIMVLGLIKSKFYLDYLGGNTVGLVNLFSQIIGYLSLVEGGIGQAIIYRLYKPTSQKDYNKVAKIRNGTISIFKKIILIIFTLSLAVGFIIPFLIKDNQFTTSHIVINFVLYVLSEIILYTTVFERSVYVATEKSYKINRIIKTSLVFKHIFEIVMAIVLQNITVIFTCLIIISLLENIIIKIISKKDFPNIPETNDEDRTVLKDVKDLMVHKVAGLVASNIDIVLISKFIGLGKVLIYSTYLMYVNAIMSLTNKISRAIVGTIGNILIENKKNAYDKFIKFNGLCFFLVFLIAGPFNMFINGFINLFYNNKVATSTITSLLFTLVLSYNIIRIPLITYSEGAGLFKETKICPIIESIINLSLSIVLVNIYGINGCLLGTIISLVISEYLIKPRIIYKKLFDNNVSEYYKNHIKFIIILVIQMASCYFLSGYLCVNNLKLFVLYAAIYGILNLVILIALYKIMKQDYLFEFINKFKESRK